MARGSSYGDKPPLAPPPFTTQTPIPRRSTRMLPEVHTREEKVTRVLPERHTDIHFIEHREFHPLARYRSRFTLLIVSIAIVVLGALVLISAGIFQRNDNAKLVKASGCYLRLTLVAWILPGGLLQRVHRKRWDRCIVLD